MYDVIVVGLGPAGATAARALAAAGLRVLGLDQAQFPRYKACGGGLSHRLERLLDPEFHAVVERTVYGTTVVFPGGRAVRARIDRPVIYTVMRARFDHLLVDQARRAGAAVREGERVRDVRVGADALEVATAAGRYQARFLVGADGAHGVVGRALAMGSPGRRAALIEGELARRATADPPPADEALLEFGQLAGGYGWIFPKAGAHLSVGVGGLGATGQRPKAHYHAFLQRYPVIDPAGGRQYGHALPLWNGRRGLTRGRALLVGDAGALVDPFTGEGIYFAVRSGQLAADVIRAAAGAGRGDLAAYDRRLAAELYPELAVARRVAFWVYRFPRLAQAIVERHPAVLERYSGIFRGELTYRQLVREGRARLLRDLVGLRWLMPPPSDPRRVRLPAAGRQDAG